MKLNLWEGSYSVLKSLGEDSGIAITVASYLTPKGNNIQGQGITPDKLLDLPDAIEYGTFDDKWVECRIISGVTLEKKQFQFKILH